MKKLLNKLAVALVVMSTAPAVCFAGGPGFDKDLYNWNSRGDDDDGDDDHSGGDCDDDDGINDIPLDGGLGLLLAAGGAYGIKKVRDRKGTGKEK